MGETGADIKLSPAAQAKIPFSFECKNTETGFTACYKAYDQCVGNTNTMMHCAVVVVKQNHCRALAILDAEELINLITKV